MQLEEGLSSLGQIQLLQEFYALIQGFLFPAEQHMSTQKWNHLDRIPKAHWLLERYFVLQSNLTVTFVEIYVVTQDK